MVAYFTLAEATMAPFSQNAPHFIQDLDRGIVAITFNLIVMLAVSAFTRKNQQTMGLNE
ncbi:hypothetical protein IOC57_03020 [Bacillus sp. SD075]|uniref:hypothetical protein n=1 Tax=Bacillus sp. SD075 TaxID=2781732 RepID=UPI001A97331B|nr:hypothetical protein [Bacillus sp. SD075]MBO0996734.1 hypothetical protein [Bacillus sp. SD075]